MALQKSTQAPALTVGNKLTTTRVFSQDSTAQKTSIIGNNVLYVHYSYLGAVRKVRHASVRREGISDAWHRVTKAMGGGSIVMWRHILRFKTIKRKVWMWIKNYFSVLWDVGLYVDFIRLWFNKKIWIYSWLFLNMYIHKKNMWHCIRRV